MTKQKTTTKTTKINTHPISIAIQSTHIADALDEMDDVLGQQYEELMGIREAFISYHQTTQRIIQELLEELKAQDIKYGIEKINLETALALKVKVEADKGIMHAE